MTFYRTMSLLLAPAVLIAGSISSSPAAGSTPAAKFLVIVERFKTFFAAEPVAFSKQKFLRSPTKLVFNAHKYSVSSIEHDVQKTGSADAPYKGHIDLMMTDRVNRKGNLFQTDESGRTYYSGWDNLADTIKASHDDRLFVAADPPELIRFTFNYTHDAWKFSDVVRKSDGGPPHPIQGALRMDDWIALPVDENKPWLTLIQ